MANFFSDYFDYTKDTESPMFYHRWCAISGIAALLGRQYQFPHGHFIVYPNFYTMLIGEPGARKSTAISIIKKLVQATGYNTVASNKTTKEKFLLDLEGGFDFSQEAAGDEPSDFQELFGSDDNSPREVLIAADEFGDFLGANNVEFVSLLTTLWDNLDHYDNRIKTGKSVHIVSPTVNILSGSTATGFAQTFPPEIMGQGFLSRMLLVYSDPSNKKIPFPTRPDDAATIEIVNSLSRIKNTVTGLAELEPTAKAMLEKIYVTFEGLEDSRFKSYSTRRFTHLLKLCLVTAAAHYSTSITEEHVLLANTILSYTETKMPMALGEFGKSKHSDIAHKIMTHLYEATAPVTANDLWKVVHTDLENMVELGKILQGLAQAEKIQGVVVAGKPAGYLPKRKPISPSAAGLIDYTLLEETK